jgi:succinate dehydrogenase hydrophobic anchor subunit
VFGHLALMHVLQGVFDITTAGSLVVGTAEFNESGTATEFVHDRWNYMLGPIALWRVYDIALLSLVTVHGFNGLRYVLTDYTMDKPLLRRASVYLCIIGGLTLLVVGGAALIIGVPETNIQMLTEAAARINGSG